MIDLDVTPESAGWGYSGLRVITLAAGEEHRRRLHLRLLTACISHPHWRRSKLWVIRTTPHCDAFRRLSAL